MGLRNLFGKSTTPSIPVVPVEEVTVSCCLHVPLSAINSLQLWRGFLSRTSREATNCTIIYHISSDVLQPALLKFPVLLQTVSVARNTTYSISSKIVCHSFFHVLPTDLS